MLAYWKHRISSGTTEGLNREIKTKLHQTCGLRDEGFFMPRLHALHQAHDKFIG
ncbi:transposase [Prosthecobacter sp.]